MLYLRLLSIGIVIKGKWLYYRKYKSYIWLQPLFGWLESLEFKLDDFILKRMFLKLLLTECKITISYMYIYPTIKWNQCLGRCPGQLIASWKPCQRRLGNCETWVRKVITNQTSIYIHTYTHIVILCDFFHDIYLLFIYNYIQN